MSPEEFSNKVFSHVYATLKNTGDAAVLRMRSSGTLMFSYRDRCDLACDTYLRETFEAVMTKRYESGEL